MVKVEDIEEHDIYLKLWSCLHLPRLLLTLIPYKVTVSISADRQVSPLQHVEY